ncbi:hypothetical protein [Microcoleus sp.]|uniref:hypothetical protein n=1 Tax=Microcoleus sp. TaxID=44472 RepID=UPI003524EFD8
MTQKHFTVIPFPDKSNVTDNNVLRASAIDNSLFLPATDQPPHRNRRHPDRLRSLLVSQSKLKHCSSHPPIQICGASSPRLGDRTRSIKYNDNRHHYIDVLDI